MRKKSIFNKKKHVPWFLVPKIRKRHILPIYQTHKTPWRLFAEGVLRNRFFHDAVMSRGTKCMACNHHFNDDHTIHHSRVEKHHHCYLRLCVGEVLPDNSEDIYRPTKNTEFNHVPDCRQCKIERPEYFYRCVKKIFPVHSECHDDIHELEQYRFTKLSKKIKTSWGVAA